MADLLFVTLDLIWNTVRHASYSKTFPTSKLKNSPKTRSNDSTEFQRLHWGPADVTGAGTLGLKISERKRRGMDLLEVVPFIYHIICG